MSLLLFKDVSGGFDNGIFLDNNIVLSERKWIEIRGKGIWSSPWLNDTEMFYDAKGNEIDEWELRLWKAENFKLREIGEFSVNYEMDGDLDNPDGTYCDTTTELFVKNEYFETFEDNIYKNGIEFIKNLRINFGIYVDKNNCCGNAKSLADCQQCSSKTAPTPLDHHWTKEQLFYEMTVTGNTFKLAFERFIKPSNPPIDLDHFNASI